jgi:hypothetical protein
MNHQQALNVRRYRTLTGMARKVALREHFAQSHGVDFAKAHHAMPHEARAALAEMAKAVCWRKPIGCPLNLGAAFYNWLQRGA